MKRKKLSKKEKEAIDLRKRLARKAEAKKAEASLATFGFAAETLAQINSPTKRLLARILESEFAQLDDLSLVDGLTPADKRAIKRRVVKAIKEAAALMVKANKRTSSAFADKLRAVYNPKAQVEQICRAVCAVITAARR